MSEHKYCVGCRYMHSVEFPGFESSPWNMLGAPAETLRFCHRPTGRDPVTGVETISGKQCREERIVTSDAELCGPEGKYWEPKWV